MSEDRGPSGGSLLLAFLAGAAAGAVVALLTAPKSGRDMRESVGSWVRRGGAGDAVNQVNAATPNPLTVTFSVQADGMAVAAEVVGNTGTFTWNNGWSEGTDQAAASSSSTTGNLAVTVDGTATASATHTNQNKAVIVGASLKVAH